MKVKYFLIGILLIFSGIFLEIAHSNMTGSSIGPLNSNFGFGWIVSLLGIPLILLSIFRWFGRKESNVKADSEIEEIRRYMESYHKREIPDVDVLYSDTLEGYGFAWLPYKGNRNLEELYEKGLSKEDVEKINTKKHTIVLPTKKCIHDKIINEYKEIVKEQKIQDYYHVKDEVPTRVSYDIAQEISSLYENFDVMIYGTKWHELGHIVSKVFGINNVNIREGISIAYFIKCLLLGAKEGKIKPPEKAIETIEKRLKGYEQVYGYENLPYQMGLQIIKKYNPNLNFRNRDLDGLIQEVDRSIDYCLSFSENMKKKK